MGEPEDLDEALVASILKGMAETAERVTGAPGLPSVAAQEALMTALAIVFEADPTYSTPARVREATEAAARDIRGQVLALRKHREETGATYLEAHASSRH